MNPMRRALREKAATAEFEMERRFTARVKVTWKMPSPAPFLTMMTKSAGRRLAFRL